MQPWATSLYLKNTKTKHLKQTHFNLKENKDGLAWRRFWNFLKVTYI